MTGLATSRVFVPSANETYSYDADGNQTLVTTGTGAWQVEYNGENRPVKWSRVSPDSSTPNSPTPTLVSMAYDHQGRRSFYVEATAGVTNKLHRFTYDDYVCVARNRGVDVAMGTGDDAFIWDPTEPIATRPLMCSLATPQSLNSSAFFCSLDGNKNVTELVGEDGDLAAHYEYSAFGKTLLSLSADGLADKLNPWRFSSEYADDALGLVYYNYRHYNPQDDELWHAMDHCRLGKSKFSCEEEICSEIGAYGHSDCAMLSGAAKDECIKNGARNSAGRYDGCRGRNVAEMVDSIFGRGDCR